MSDPYSYELARWDIAERLARAQSAPPGPVRPPQRHRVRTAVRRHLGTRLRGLADRVDPTDRPEHGMRTSTPTAS